MIEKVKIKEQRYNELSNKLSEPGIADDQKLFTDLRKNLKILLLLWKNTENMKRRQTALTKLRNFLKPAEWTKILRKWFNLNLMSLKRYGKIF